MVKIDLEKLICSFAKRKYFSEEKLQGALKEQGLEYKDGEIVEIPKPKFKVGNWVVDEHGDCFIINSIERGFYFTQLSGSCYQTPLDIDLVDNSYHAWTIEDAKDGDMLCGYLEADYPWIGIFHKLNVDGTFNSYCYLQAGLHGKFCPPSGENIFGKRNVDNHSSSDVVPATRKQRALLFQKMKEAGYEWDNEKKELKKIEKTRPMLSDFFNAEYERGKASFANRQLYNRAILKLLSDYVEKYPDIRFGQMLCNLDVKPHFDEESKETYCNLNEIINKKS